uniref:Uncharacterized protein n=1 Tax=Paramormyrops kingsleyae TaxID=1676925 RepID=A0A3B3T4S3_9TELE
MLHTCCVFECAIIAGKSPPSSWLLFTTLHLLLAKAVARRAALQDLLEKDRQQCTVELKQIGEAFYPQRK